MTANDVYANLGIRGGAGGGNKRGRRGDFQSAPVRAAGYFRASCVSEVFGGAAMRRQLPELRLENGAAGPEQRGESLWLDLAVGNC